MPEKVDHPQLRFVIEALKAFADSLPHGLQIEIRSEFSSTIGFGSSAAVLAAMLDGLNTICHTKLNRDALFALGHQIILKIQGRGSGTDLAASLCGGILYYQPAIDGQAAVLKTLPEKLSQSLQLTLLYSGYKTPTAVVLQQVATHWQQQPGLLKNLYDLMGDTTQSATAALQAGNLQAFFRLGNVYQGLMDALGVNDAKLSQLVYGLRAIEGMGSAKISGSGLGDCVLGLSNTPVTLPTALNDYVSFSVKPTPRGAATETLS
nr:GHMP kinase [Thiomicrorhabdus cannonii]